MGRTGWPGAIADVVAWFLSTSRRRLLLLTLLAYLLLFIGVLSSLLGGGTDPALAELESPAAGDIAPVRDPFVVTEDGVRYLFGTGEGLPRLRSTDGRTWESLDVVFPDGLPGWTDRFTSGNGSAWAPSLAFFAERWHLYYAVSTFGTWTSAVGLATSPTLDPDDPDYGWTDQGVVVSSEHDAVFAELDGASDQAWNAIDPHVVLDEDRQPWLSWGSFADGIYLRRLDPSTGRLDEAASVYHLAEREPWIAGLEAVDLAQRDGSWYLFASWDFCCRQVQSTYNIRVGRAEDITGPYVDQQGRPLLAGGGSLVLGTQGRTVGPGHSVAVRDGDGWFLVHHFYDGEDEGASTLSIRPLLWTSDGWPVAADPGFVPAQDSEEVDAAAVAGSWEVTGYAVDDAQASHEPRRLDLGAGGSVGRDAGSWRLRDGVVELAASVDCGAEAWTYELFVDAAADEMYGRTSDGRPVQLHRTDPDEAAHPSPAC